MSGSIDRDCKRCRARGQARYRQQKARNSGDLNKAPIPRVRVSRSDIYETWKILEHLIEVRRDLEAHIAQCAPSGGMTLELNRAYQALLAALERYSQLADELEQKVEAVYPPIPRPESSRPARVSNSDAETLDGYAEWEAAHAVPEES
jgi:hypothetical protein